MFIPTSQYNYTPFVLTAGYWYGRDEEKVRHGWRFQVCSTNSGTQGECWAFPT